jgi:hypothetical protein
VRPVSLFLLGAGVAALAAGPWLGTPWPGVWLAGMGLGAYASILLEKRWSTTHLEARVLALETALKETEEKIKSVSSQLGARRHLGG